MPMLFISVTTAAAQKKMQSCLLKQRIRLMILKTHPVQELMRYADSHAMQQCSRRDASSPKVCTLRRGRSPCHPKGDTAWLNWVIMFISKSSGLCLHSGVFIVCSLEFTQHTLSSAHKHDLSKSLLRHVCLTQLVGQILKLR